MSDRNLSNLPFESDEADEKALWSALGGLPEEAPSADMRRSFYRSLDHAGSETLPLRVRRWLGFGSNTGWLTATACGVLGFALAGGLSTDSAPDTERLAALEENVALLNRELILDRLSDANAGTRLKGVFDARDAMTDDEVVQALLVRATDDDVRSVRTAAIDMLGQALASTGVGEELMQLLEQTKTPSVQLALVDMVLRYGTREQLERLVVLAGNGHLHSDLSEHVFKSLGGETA